MSGNDTSDKFTTADPLHNIVTLTHKRWYKITTGHSELITEIAEIKETIENPDNIFQDKEYEHNFCYYRQHNNIILRQFGTQLKVVVNRDLGTIITAYATNKKREKTKPVFKKPKVDKKEEAEE